MVVTFEQLMDKNDFRQDGIVSGGSCGIFSPVCICTDLDSVGLLRGLASLSWEEDSLWSLKRAAEFSRSLSKVPLASRCGR